MLTDCPGCGAKHPPDLAVCPQCGYGGDEMPKTTRLGGASNAALDLPADSPAPEAAPAAAPGPVAAPTVPETAPDEAGGPEATTDDTPEPEPEAAAVQARPKRARRP